MAEQGTYERFPLWIVVLSNLVTASIYAIGAYILAGFGVIASALFLLYCLSLELRVLKRSCVNCYYYGRICGFGKGRVCALLFRKGDPKKFAEDEISWKDMLPDMMVLAFPLIGAALLLIRGFTWQLVLLLAVYLALNLAGNAVIRGSFTCKFCRQRKLGCPAEKLFSKGK